MPSIRKLFAPLGPRLALLALFLLLLGGFAYVAHLWRYVASCVHPVRKPIAAGEQEEARRSMPGLADAALTTRDGLRLAAWYLPGRNGAAVVFVHGVWGNRMTFVREARHLAARGYGVLLYDARAHGSSEGTLCSWGDRERDDVRAAVDFLASRPEVQRIGAVGFSMGASAVALAAVDEARLQALVLASGSPSFREAEVWDDSALEALVSLALYRWYGLRVDDLDVVAALHRMTPRPTLIVSGSLDAHVPAWMTEEVYAAAPAGKDLYQVDGAAHGGFTEGPSAAAYLDRLVTFLDAALLPAPATR